MQQQETQRDDVQHYDNRIGAEVQKPLVGIPARANGAQYQHQIENKQATKMQLISRSMNRR